MTTADHLAKQAVEVAKLKALRRMGGEERAALGIPGDIADGECTQVGRTGFVTTDFADKAELTGTDLQNTAEQRFEGFALIVGIDIGRLRFGDQRQ